ncbi:response regulator [Methanoregula sp.]|uniref:response regulator n=1 Tax=Methanoregula sp. TaxID=2052170 RepID=UPI002BE19534|nr:response regulator [Methanoregula sp.]HVP96087.1 response regulator [Methanoregula sp.]
MTEKTVLIVEDEGLIALHLTETLENRRFRIIGTVHSGEMALQTLEKSQKPDLIIMDIGLTGSLDGIETARKIRQQYTIPIIFLTAYSDKNRMEKAKELSAVEYLIKPVTEEDLLTAIRNALDMPKP